MITAKNYAAQAEKDLFLMVKNINEIESLEKYKQDAQAVLLIAKDINIAVHFTMPDYGRIFDDRLSGIKNNKIRLPYPLITIEYFCPTDLDEKLNDRSIIVNKRLIIAREIPSELAIILELVDKSYITNGTEYLIFITSCCFVNGHWMPSPFGWLMPDKWDDVTNNKILNPMDSNKELVIAGGPIKLLPVYIKEYEEEKGIGQALITSYNDIAQECTVLLELCEALSCKNVQPSIYQEASPKNDNRIKSGKLPFYETKFLTINATGSKGKDNKTGVKGSHASPRQHLRRGHIRRLETGNIWVNSCVVGDATIGKIKKDYHVV